MVRWTTCGRTGCVNIKVGHPKKSRRRRALSRVSCAFASAHRSRPPSQAGPSLRRVLEHVEEIEPPTLEQKLEWAHDELKQVQDERDRKGGELIAQCKKAKCAMDAHRKLKARGKEQRAQQVSKTKEQLQTMKAKCDQRIKESRARNLEAAREKAQKEQAAKAVELKKRLQAVRARARAKENAAKLSGKRLKRAQCAEATVKELQAALEEDISAAVEEEEEKQDLRTVEKSRRDERGRFRALPNRVCVLIWAQLARRVAPSAVNANISDAVRELAPAEQIPLPCEREINKMRGELTIASEAIAVFRVALCRRIISFGWDESTKFGLGLLSSNTQIEPNDAPGTMVDVVMRSGSLTAGGTSEAVARSIEKNIFGHARQLIAGWKEEHEKEHGAGSWVAAGGPEPESIGIHRLSEHTLLMPDTCNGARKCKRLIAEATMAAAKEKIGMEAWNAMTQEERDDKRKVYIGECHQHLRNIIINAMATKATDCLKDELEDSLAELG